jgi:recombination protein RecA
MARKEQPEVPVAEETDATKLSKLIVKEFNKNPGKTGKIAWNLASDEDNPTDVKEWISTGNLLLNYNIANKKGGGVPVGKLIEICGEEASGKSLMCMHIAAETQKLGGVVGYIDTENAFNPDFAKQIGVDLNRLVYLQPGTVEEVGETIVKMIVMTRQKSPNQLVTIIWDSVTQTPTQAEVEGTFEINMNVQMEKPKALGKMMRKIIETLGKERICLVFTSQVKFKPGTMYGDPTFIPGGKAVPYAASVRIKLVRGAAEKEGATEDEAGKGDVLGVNTTATVFKNRLGPPHRKAKFFISFANGIQDESSWFDYLHSKKVIEKASGFCYIPEFDKEVKTKKELAFREAKWLEVLNGTPGLKDWVLNRMDQLLTIKYGEVPDDAEVDPESMLEAEQLVEDLVDPK